VKLVCEGMRRVVNDPDGTAFGARISQPGMEMAGKTGSAQVRHISMAEHLAGVRKNENLPWDMRDHALFIAFAPVGQPRYVPAPWWSSTAVVAPRWRGPSPMTS
jgi:penicillin-binding protein 2